MRGQAFVSFRDKKSADQAKKDVNEFPLYGKPIVSSRWAGGMEGTVDMEMVGERLDTTARAGRR
jgi:hypothetical protein